MVPPSTVGNENSGARTPASSAGIDFDLRKKRIKVPDAPMNFTHLLRYGGDGCRFKRLGASGQGGPAKAASQAVIPLGCRGLSTKAALRRILRAKPVSGRRKHWAQVNHLAFSACNGFA